MDKKVKNIKKTGKIISFVLTVLISSLIFSPASLQAGLLQEGLLQANPLHNFLRALGLMAPEKKGFCIGLGSFNNISKKQAIIGIAGATACALSAIVTYKLTKYVKNHESKIKFDFDSLKFEAKDLKFENKNNKEPFLWGVATSAYQVEGKAGFDGKKDEPRNQWEAFEGKQVEIGGKMCTPVPYISGDACKHWEKYKEDIDLAKKLGFNTFRLSIAWEKVEPKCGEFSQDALRHYEDVCKYIVDKGIKPVITLHHYTDPFWFAGIGGFEKEENIKYFVKFCEQVFTRLNKYRPLWFTFNTFEGYAMPGYSQGTKPPFKKDMGLAIEVLKNLLESHVRVYRALKLIDCNSNIGIYKNIHQLDPWNLLNPIDILVGYIGDYIVNDSIYNFFKTGVFKVWIPFKVNMNYEDKSAIGALDQVGLNYYSGKFVKNGKFITRPGCMPTQNKEHCAYPEGFYRAIKDVSRDFAMPLNIPIYVTENGVAALSDADRGTFYKQYLYALSKAIQEGADVRGYVTWTLMDNYEWTHGYNVKYGLCSVDHETQERKLKPGTEFLLEVVNNNQVK